MARIGKIGSNLARQSDGIWEEYEGTGFELRIAHMSSSGMEQGIRAALKSLGGKGRRKKSRDLSDLSMDDQVNLLAPLLSKYVVKDWRNLENDQGEPIEFSEEECLSILLNKKFRDLFQFILEVAGDSQSYSDEAHEEDKQNLTDFSSGT